MTATRPALLCFDGSANSANAIARAGELLRNRRALVVHSWSGVAELLLHSDLEGMSGAIVEAADEIDFADRARAERVAAEGAQLAIAAGFDAQPIVAKEYGNTWKTLARCAEEHCAAVVVAGSHGRSWVASKLLGSVSNGLVNHPPAPVLVVPGAATRAGAGPLFFCDDGSDNARVAMTAGVGLLAGRSATVTSIYHSWSARVPRYVPVVSGEAMGMAKELDEIVVEEVEETVAEGAALVERLGVACEGVAVHSEASYSRGLLTAADARDARAIIVGSRGMTGLDALGSVSQGLAHHSDRPVLVVPPEPVE